MWRSLFVSHAVTSCACSVDGKSRHPSRRQIHGQQKILRRASALPGLVLVRPCVILVGVLDEADASKPSWPHRPRPPGAIGGLAAGQDSPVPANGRKCGLKKKKERRQARRGEETVLKAHARRRFGSAVSGPIDRSCGSLLVVPGARLLTERKPIPVLFGTGAIRVISRVRGCSGGAG